MDKTERLNDLKDSMVAYADATHKYANQMVSSANVADVAEKLGDKTYEQLVATVLEPLTTHAKREDNPHGYKASDFGGVDRTDLENMKGASTVPRCLPITQWGALDDRAPPVATSFKGSTYIIDPSADSLHVRDKFPLYFDEDNNGFFLRNAMVDNQPKVMYGDVFGNSVTDPQRPEITNQVYTLTGAPYPVKYVFRGGYNLVVGEFDTGSVEEKNRLFFIAKTNGKQNSIRHTWYTLKVDGNVTAATVKRLADMCELGYWVEFNGGFVVAGGTRKTSTFPYFRFTLCMGYPTGTNEVTMLTQRKIESKYATDDSGSAHSVMSSGYGDTDVFLTDRYFMDSFSKLPLICTSSTGDYAGFSRDSINSVVNDPRDGEKNAVTGQTQYPNSRVNVLPYLKGSSKFSLELGLELTIKTEAGVPWTIIYRIAVTSIPTAKDASTNFVLEAATNGNGVKSGTAVLTKDSNGKSIVTGDVEAIENCYSALPYKNPVSSDLFSNFTPYGYGVFVMRFTKEHGLIFGRVATISGSTSMDMTYSLIGGAYIKGTQQERYSKAGYPKYTTPVRDNLIGFIPLDKTHALTSVLDSEGTRRAVYYAYRNDQPNRKVTDKDGSVYDGLPLANERYYVTEMSPAAPILKLGANNNYESGIVSYCDTATGDYHATGLVYTSKGSNRRPATVSNLSGSDYRTIDKTVIDKYIGTQKTQYDNTYWELYVISNERNLGVLYVIQCNKTAGYQKVMHPVVLLDNGYELSVVKWGDSKVIDSNPNTKGLSLVPVGTDETAFLYSTCVVNKVGDKAPQFTVAFNPNMCLSTGDVKPTWGRLGISALGVIADGGEVISGVNNGDYYGTSLDGKLGGVDTIKNLTALLFRPLKGYQWKALDTTGYMVVTDSDTDDNWTVYFTRAVPLVLLGLFRQLPITSVDLRTKNKAPANKTFYFYAKLKDELTAPEYIVMSSDDDLDEFPHEDSHYLDDTSTDRNYMYLGYAKTDAKGITECNIQKVTNLDGHRLSGVARGQSIPVTGGTPMDTTKLTWSN